MTSQALCDLVIDALEELKGRDILSLPVAEITDITDFMVLVSGTSNRHVRALVNQVVEMVKEEGVNPIGIEGTETNEWVLVDLGDVLVHVMQPDARKFYDLERLWTEIPSDSESVV